MEIAFFVIKETILEVYETRGKRVVTIQNKLLDGLIVLTNHMLHRYVPQPSFPRYSKKEKTKESLPPKSFHFTLFNDDTQSFD